MVVPVNQKEVRPLLSPRYPIWSLTLAFALWKSLVFFVVIACPGPGYDTSTSLLPYLTPIPPAGSATDPESRFRAFPLKFVRWDSIYFVHIIEHGYVFEQEWAFGYGYTKLLQILTSRMTLRIDFLLLSIYSPALTMAYSSQALWTSRQSGPNSLDGNWALTSDALSVCLGRL